jgi:hypothetical protein
MRDHEQRHIEDRVRGRGGKGARHDPLFFPPLPPLAGEGRGEGGLQGLSAGDQRADGGWEGKDLSLDLDHHIAPVRVLGFP